MIYLTLTYSMQTFIPPLAITLMQFVFEPQQLDSHAGGVRVLREQWILQGVQVGCWFYINLGGNRILRAIGDWMKYPSYFIVLSQIVLIPLLSIGHWIYNYEITIFEENNLLKG